MIEIWLAVVSLAVIIILAAVVAMGLAVLKRHRYVFNVMQGLEQRLDDMWVRLRVEMRHQDVLYHSSQDVEQRLPRRFTAQFGEDIIIYDFFRSRQPGYFIEAGAFDGVSISNTYLLESLGWRGLLVEANPAFAAKCKDNRPGSKVVNAAIGPASASGEVDFTCVGGGGEALSYLSASSKHIERCEKSGGVASIVRVPFTSLDQLLEGETVKVDLVSLDLEGMELEALRGLALERYQPDLIVVEHETQLSGSELEGYLREKGYFAEARNACNVFFVHEHMREEFRSVLTPEDRALIAVV